MGTITVIRFNKDVDPEIARKFGEWCNVSSGELSINNIESAPLAKIFSFLIPLKKSLIFGPYFLPERHSKWNAFHSDVIGAVLGPEDVQGSTNPISDFDSALPSPCLGHVKDGSPILCAFKPKGHLAMIGDNLVFSQQLINFLGSEKVGRITHSVHVKGTRHKSWFGFDFQHTCRVISPLCYSKQTRCTLCQTSYTPWRGMWLGTQNETFDTDVCFDVIGYEHGQTCHPIIIANKLANSLTKLFPKNGFNIEPIYDVTCDIGRLISFVCNFFDNNFLSKSLSH